MQLGIGSYTYVWSTGVPGFPQPDSPLTPEGLLKIAADAGLHVVQIADNMPLHEFNEDRLVALKRLADELQIEIEMGTSGIQPDHLRFYLRIAKLLGAKFLRTLLDSHGHEPSVAEAMQLLTSVLPELKSAGVCLGIENHDRLRSAELQRLMKLVNSPLVGICLDTANSLGCGEGLETVLTHLAPWVVNLHVKDFDVCRLPHLKGFTVEGRPAGQGLINMEYLLNELRGNGRDFNVIVELWPPHLDPPEASIALEHQWAAESIRFLRQFIPE